MAIDTRISFYGIGIEAPDVPIKFYGIGIEAPDRQADFYGIGIEADNVFNANIQVVDIDQNAIEGATVSVVSTQSPPGNYIGDLSGLTDSGGLFSATGSTTVGTTVEVSKTDRATIKFTVPQFLGGSAVYCLPEAGGAAASKKIYTTNKGNILINPNDTILIELN